MPNIFSHLLIYLFVASCVFTRLTPFESRIAAQLTPIFLLLLLIFVTRRRINPFKDVDVLILSIPLTYGILSFLIRISFDDDYSAFSIVSLYLYIIPIMCLILRRANFSKVYFNALSLAFLITSLAVLHDFFLPDRFISFAGLGRARGFYQGTLNLSGALGATIFFIMGYWKGRGVCGNVIVTLALFTSIVTMSRGLWVGTLLGISFIAIKKPNNKTAVLLCLLLAAAFNNTLSERFISIFDIDPISTHGETNHTRLQAWSEGVHDIIYNPFGKGIGTSGSTIRKLVGYRTSGYESFFLSMINQYSILGFLFFYIVIHIAKRCNFDRYGWAAIISVLVQNLLQESLSTPTTLILFWSSLVYYSSLSKRRINKLRLHSNFIQR